MSGATLALIELTKHFTKDLPARLPKMWDLMVGQLIQMVDPDSFRPATCLNRDKESEQIVWALQVLEVTSQSAHGSLLPGLMSAALPRCCILLSHPYRQVRHLASRCLAAFAKLNSVSTMEQVVVNVLPMLDASDSEIDRQVSKYELNIVYLIVQKKYV